jgi:hypothetical protein
VKQSVIMKSLFLILFTSMFLFGCKKTIEKAAENAILKAMTDGQWVVTSFKVDSTDITSDFSSYKFQYYSNYTVDAFKNGAVEKTGTWQADPNAMNISGNFPNAINPLDLINGTWHINDNGWTFVKATMTVGSETRTLRLDKL